MATIAWINKANATPKYSTRKYNRCKVRKAARISPEISVVSYLFSEIS